MHFRTRKIQHILTTSNYAQLLHFSKTNSWLAGSKRTALTAGKPTSKHCIRYSLHCIFAALTVWDCCRLARAHAQCKQKHGTSLPVLLVHTNGRAYTNIHVCVQIVVKTIGKRCRDIQMWEKCRQSLAEQKSFEAVAVVYERETSVSA